MNNLETLQQELETLYSMYPKHPEFAEEIARKIEMLEEYLEMCYDSKNIHKYVGEVRVA